jgi:predicted dehydrogenase
VSNLALAQVGCGGMGLRHVYGLIEAHRHGIARFDLIALCDLNEAAARHVADEAEKELGRRPAIHTDFATMLRKQPGLEAINVVTDTRMHHRFAVEALGAGKHVAVEKPMAITVRAGRLMVEAAERAGKVLSISENFRRDPLIRLAKAAIQADLIGMPRFVLDLSVNGSRWVQQTTAWRHKKLRGGWMLDSAVHDADMIHYLIGAVRDVTAETALWEPLRAMLPRGMPRPERERQIADFYGHRVKEEADAEAVEATADDAAFALMRFDSGAIGQFACSIATPGQVLESFIVYGAGGSLTLPANRTGQPLKVTPIGRAEPLSIEDLFVELPHFRLDEATSLLFGGKKRLGSYALSFAEIDRKLIAVELTDFADAILDRRQPEIGGVDGINAVAFVYAVLESGHARTPCEFAAVVDDRINTYQQEINASIGL